MERSRKRRRPAWWICAALGIASTVVQPRAVVTVGGTVEGQVSVETRPTRRLGSAGAYPGRTVTVASTAGGSELANVVVFVDLSTSIAAPPSQATVRQTNEVFVPRVTPVTVGTTIDFPNDDGIFHNVFSLSRGATFDLGRYPRGESKGRRFDSPGIVKVFCHLHSHMTALVRVFSHPYFTQPDAAGRFALPRVPAGRYRVVAWHERVGEVAHEALVADGGSVSLNFSLPLTDTP